MATNYKVVPDSIPVPTILVVNCYNQSFKDDRILVLNVKFLVPLMSIPVPPVVEDVVKTVNSDPDLGTYIYIYIDSILVTMHRQSDNPSYFRHSDEYFSE